MYVCVWRVRVSCLCWAEGSEGVYAARGLGRCACGSPGGEPESPPVLSHFPERIVFVLSEEERPARREVGPQLGGGVGGGGGGNGRGGRGVL